MSNNEETLVLVADDEPSTLALVTAHVRSKKGFKVVEASDGDMAWQLAHEHLPDLVILDVMMPGMSGWEVCRKIRESLPLAHTGVIMLTGIGENLNEMTSPLYGADAHVDKPFEFTDLDEKIETTLKARREGAFGRADHADEEAGEPMDVSPAVTQPSPPISKPDEGKAKKKKMKAVELPDEDPIDAADDDDDDIEDEAPVKPAKVSRKKVAEEQLTLPGEHGVGAAKPKKAPAKAKPAATKSDRAPKAEKPKPEPVKASKKAAKKAPAKVAKKAPAKAAKKAAKKAPAKVAKKAPAKVAKKAPAKAAKKAAKKAPAKVAKKAPAKAAKKAAKKAKRK